MSINVKSAIIPGFGMVADFGLSGTNCLLVARFDHNNRENHSEIFLNGFLSGVNLTSIKRSHSDQPLTVGTDPLRRRDSPTIHSRNR